MTKELTEKDRAVIQSYKRVFGTVDGQIVTRDLMAAHHYNSSTLAAAGNPIDPLMLAVAEGERNVILRILTMLSIKE